MLNGFSSFSQSAQLINLLIIYANSFHVRSAYDNEKKKYVGTPNCLTLASKFHKNFFQDHGFPLTGLIKEITLLLATNLSIVPSKLF